MLLHTHIWLLVVLHSTVNCRAGTVRIHSLYKRDQNKLKSLYSCKSTQKTFQINSSHWKSIELTCPDIILLGWTWLSLLNMHPVFFLPLPIGYVNCAWTRFGRQTAYFFVACYDVCILACILKYGILLFCWQAGPLARCLRFICIFWGFWGAH